MNTKNNKRRRESRESIEKVFIGLLQAKELNQISVSDICKKAGLNRSTFYANYVDIYELADTIRNSLEENLNELYREDIAAGFNSNDYLRLFQHIRNNQLFYKTYFKLGYDNDYKIVQYDTNLAKAHFGNRFIEYHCEFFKQGITAIIKKWLAKGCTETAEEMNEIIMSEYRGRAESVR
ncbi:TetR/AcrR family transcriptional regulator [Clostridium transplantifaecale]|uniref:TetR/AcrR family transcriptional regulator n=1 Tax=Clostridium transplantifaecale TaxID=2479838 RepID=UPI000F62D782|nr:TetR/AcrR family transcriptional regulator [Clostridium transplantifaecale]